MIKHIHLGETPFGRLRALRAMIVSGQITLGGNIKCKIYGEISCRAGKRMKPESRIFFVNQQEAITAGYRPCAVCLTNDYKLWKQNK